MEKYEERESCENCNYCDGVEFKEGVMYCLRYPPKIVFSRKGQVFHRTVPTVHTWDFCGEFQKRLPGRLPECEKCKFWLSRDEINERAGGELMPDDLGICYKYPPQTGLTVEKYNKEVITSMFPITPGNHWCGEWQGKAEEDESNINPAH